MKFISLFAGIGGFDLGLERAGMQCVGQVEINPFCQRVLEHHWPEVKRIGDIRNVNGNEFGTIDLVCGGFPCQPFSTAGKRKGATDDRYLWPEMLRVIKSYRPAWVLGENVAGIVSMALDTVLSDLEREGYETQAFIIPACAVDANHDRKRVWIIANSANTRSEDLRGRENSILVSNTKRFRFGSELRESEGQQPGSGREAWSELAAPCNWPTEPGVGRMANGVPGRVDRLRSLGNAVVPQVVEVIGRAIMQAEEGASCAQERPGEHFGSAIYRQPTAAGMQCG